MKIFTHDFVIYDKGWKFQWVKKAESFMTFNLLDVIVCLVAAYLVVTI